MIYSGAKETSKNKMSVREPSVRMSNGARPLSAPVIVRATHEEEEEDEDEGFTVQAESYLESGEQSETSLKPLTAAVFRQVTRTALKNLEGKQYKSLVSSPTARSRRFLTPNSTFTARSYKVDQRRFEQVRTIE